MNWQRCASDALTRAVTAMQAAASEDELCRVCCEAIAEDPAYPLAWIGFASADGISVVAKPALALSRQAESLCLTAIRAGTATVARVDRLAGAGACRAVVAVPFFSATSCVLVIASPYPDAFGEDALRMLENLARVLGCCLEQYRRAGDGIVRHGSAEEGLRLRMLNLLNTISDSSDDAIFAKDLDGKYLYVNREVLRQTGKTLADVIGRTDEEVYSAKACADLSLFDRKVMHLGHSLTFEEELTTVDGARIFLTTKGPLKDAGGKVFGVFGISRDITERKRDEACLELAVEAAGLDLWENNLVTGEVTRKAAKVLAELGYRDDDVRIDDMLGLVHPEDMPEFKRLLDDHLCGVTPQYRCEFRLRSSNGAWVWYANYGKIMGPRRSGQRFIGVTFNIDDRKCRENELAAREQALRTLIANSPDSIVRYDRECRRIYANPAFCAVSHDDAAPLGKKPTEYPGGPNAALYEAKIAEVFETGKSLLFELKWCGKNGREICSHIRLTPERDGAGNIVSVLGVGRDITELNEYRNELKRSELAKTRFLAAAGHDLRQPLTAANMFIHALKSTALNELQARHLQSLGHAMSTFSDLLDALLNISRLDAGVIKPEYSLIDVSDILIWLEQNFAAQARDRRLAFRLYFPMKYRLHIRSDLGLIKAVLMNLVLNAIKFTSSGSILVSARPRGADVLFQVWDTGIGISDVDMAHIFDEFYQVDNPQRDRKGGLGLGLAISRRSIALLGGEISCRSQRNRGSVFSFQLPLAAVPNPISQRDEYVGVADRRFAAGKRFVVVEDDAMVAQAIAAVLREMDGVVGCFYSAEAAMADASAACADYYIVDYMLGGALNGVQYLNWLGENAKNTVNAVLITGDTSSRFIRESAGFSWPVLFKPVDLSGLFATLGAAR